jgi:hypothetical protein
VSFSREGTVCLPVLSEGDPLVRKRYQVESSPQPMNKLIFVISIIIVSSISGCLSQSETESETTESEIITSSGSVQHNFCNLNAGEGSANSNDSSSNGNLCPTDDETIADYWSSISNLTAINQSAGNSIIVHEITGGQIGTSCSNGALTGWMIVPDNGDTYNNADTSYSEGMLPFGGLECQHTLHHLEFSNSTVYWSISYEIIPVIVE